MVHEPSPLLAKQNCVLYYIEWVGALCDMSCGSVFEILNGKLVHIVERSIVGFLTSMLRVLTLLRIFTLDCTARAITSEPQVGGVQIFKGPIESPHSHSPDHDECDAEVTKDRLKRKAKDNPEQPPAQILRTELPSAGAGVLARLPERENLKKSMRRARREDLPANPNSLNDLGDVPHRFTRTLKDDRFLIHDSGISPTSRVLVYATKQNLEYLAKSTTWLFDGTFKVAAAIFLQLFTILGIIRRTRDGVEDEAALPLAYAFLSYEEEVQYTSAPQAVQTAALKNGINNCKPQKIIAEFKKGILNAYMTVFPLATILCCFFHLGQSVLREIQGSGLFAEYCNQDRRFYSQVHMTLALAFVPVDQKKDIHPLNPLRMLSRLVIPTYDQTNLLMYGVSICLRYRSFDTNAV
ncbi:hypothetical protein QAD02_016866 [Eretmocerus hayati]|uniref:Uncharacterized protein n=1 Tax=Eretmocerus hayati TaxID=131215 RepID=A0ACC2PES6_9HYME|nr:hypothetical protein QAD02_016866 [Eretmocerus hayati]